MSEWKIGEIADFDGERGQINLGGERLFVVPASFLPELKQSFIEFMKDIGGFKEKAVEIIGKRKFFMAAYNAGKKTAEKIPDQGSKKDALLKAVEILEQTGYGKFKVVEYNPPESIIVEVENSPEAEWSLEKYGVRDTEEPVCDYLRGFAAGAADTVFGTAIQAEELMCIAKGDEICKVKFFAGGEPGDSWLMEQEIF